MNEIIITLLVLLIFLLSCDSQFLQTVKNKLWVRDSGTPLARRVDNYEILPDPLFESNDRKESFLGGREEVNTWEPSTVDFSKLGADKIYKAYAEDLKANVDQAIVESHREYTEDTDFLATTGASHASARDDFQPAVQFHGLPRKAHYAQYGSERTSRVSQSETPEDIGDIKQHNSTGYEL